MHQEIGSKNYAEYATEECPKPVRSALIRVADCLTPRHSITGRRHSIAALLREELDDVVAMEIRRFRGQWDRTLLADYRPSAIWSTVPVGARPSDADKTHAHAAVSRADAWATQLRAAFRSAAGAHETSHIAVRRAISNHLELDRFCGTLETLIYLAEDSFSFIPQRSRGSEGRHRTRGGRKIRLGGHCELCWRHAEASEISDEALPALRQFIDVERLTLAEGEVPSPRAVLPPAWYRRFRDEIDRPPSVTFCRYHNPRSTTAACLAGGNQVQASGSAYRQDLRYKDAFHEELAVLKSLRLNAADRFPQELFYISQDNTTPTGQRMHVTPFSGHSSDLRRAAYALVHSGIRGTKEQVWILRDRGHSYSEVASMLGLQRRAVINAVGTLRARVASIEAIRAGSARHPLWE